MKYSRAAFILFKEELFLYVPVPIIFGSDIKTTVILMILAAALIIVVLLFLIIMFK